MVLVVKHTVKKPSGLWSYRRYWPQDVRHIFDSTRFIRTLGRENAPGFSDRHAQREAEYAQEVAKARRKLAGDFDTLDASLIAYLAEDFRRHVLTREEELLWDAEAHVTNHKLADELQQLHVFQTYATLMVAAGFFWSPRAR